MIGKINLDQAYSDIEKPWTPVIAGAVNDTHVKIARIEGEFVWHKHEHEDEFFFIYKGRMLMRLRDGDVVLEQGECITIPRGVEHCPVALTETCEILMVEPASTVNTGNAEGERTVTDLQDIRPAKS